MSADSGEHDVREDDGFGETMSEYPSVQYARVVGKIEQLFVFQVLQEFWMGLPPGSRLTS